jgi:hypothetical protein
VPDAPDRTAEEPADALEHSLDELLGDAVVYEAGHEPEPEVVPVIDLPAERPDARPPGAREDGVSPVFWAAAVVWNLPGGIGSWWLLRKTHPRAARRLLLVGVVSFIVIAVVIFAVTAAQRALNPSYVFIKK